MANSNEKCKSSNRRQPKTASLATVLDAMRETQAQLQERLEDTEKNLLATMERFRGPSPESDTADCESENASVDEDVETEAPCADTAESERARAIEEQWNLAMKAVSEAVYSTRDFIADQTPQQDGTINMERATCRAVDDMTRNMTRIQKRASVLA